MKPSLMISIITILFCSCQNVGRENYAIIDTAVLNIDTPKLSKDILNDSIKNTWEYDTTINAMGEKTKNATISANDLVYFDFPYNGGSRGMVLIKKKLNNTDILFIISKGQINTDYDGTYVRVKFDDEKPKKYLMTETTDYSKEILFFTNANNLLQKIKKSKIMVIEVPFYESGNVMFKFNTENLKW